MKQKSFLSPHSCIMVFVKGMNHKVSQILWILIRLVILHHVYDPFHTNSMVEDGSFVTSHSSKCCTDEDCSETGCLFQCFLNWFS